MKTQKQKETIHSQRNVKNQGLTVFCFLNPQTQTRDQKKKDVVKIPWIA